MVLIEVEEGKKQSTIVPTKTQEQQLDKRMAYIAVNLIDLGGKSKDLDLVGFRAGVMIKSKRDRANRDDIYQNTFITIGIGLTGTEATSQTPERSIDLLMRETYLKKYGAKKPGSKQLRTMLALFKLLSKGKKARGRQGYFHFRGPHAQEKAQKAAQLFADCGFETKYEEGRNGFSITGLPKNLKKGYAKMRDSFLASVKEKYIAWDEAGKEKKIDASELAQEPKTKKKQEKDLMAIDPRRMTTEEGADHLETLLGRPYKLDYLDKVDEKTGQFSERRSQIARFSIWQRDKLLERKDVMKELERRVQAEQTKVESLSPQSFAIYQRLIDTGIFSVAEAAFVARLCNKFQEIRKERSPLHGKIRLGQLNLEQRLAIVHTLREMDKLPVSGPLGKTFGRFYAHLDTQNHSVLYIGYSTNPKYSKEYSREGMSHAKKANRRDDADFRAADDTAKGLVAQVKPIDYADIASLLEAGGEPSTKKFIYALTNLKRGQPVNYIASTPKEMARFAAFVDKYYPRMETRITRAPGEFGEWYVAVEKQGVLPPQTGAQWTAANIGAWVTRFDNRRKIASAIDKLGRETITITIPAKKDGTSGKPPAWFVRMVEMRGGKLKPSQYLENALSQKGVTVTLLPTKVKTRTESYGRKKVQIPVSHTYTIVFDGTKIRGELWAAREKLGLSKKKRPVPYLKPVEVGKPATEVAKKPKGKKPTVGGEIARVREKAKRKLGKKKRA